VSNLHEVSDEEVVLQSTHSFLWQDGRLPAHRTRERQRLRGNVVLEATGEREGGVKELLVFKIDPDD